MRDTRRFNFDPAKNIGEILIEGVNFIDIAGVERQRDHRLDGAQININTAIVIRHRLRVQRAIVLLTAM
ncbi:hypothetical protein D3C81_1546570 [compost metagenome]